MGGPEDDSPTGALLDVPDGELCEHFTNLASTSMPRAPLNAALSRAIADDAELYGLMRHAPRTQLNPVLLLACLHYSLLGDPDHPLVRWYPNLSPDARPADDPALAGVLRHFVDERHHELVALLRTRSTQTNEVGRSAMFLVPFGALAAELGPLAHLDVGASAGLNLLLDRFAYAYRDRDGAGAPSQVGGSSTVHLEVGTRGDPPIPPALPSITARRGIDRSPIDIADDAEARWLEACVWPDQTDRFERLRAAIAIGRAEPPEIVVADAVTALAPAVESVGGVGHPVVTNSWVLNYFTPDARTAYVAELERIGATRDLSWIWFESPPLVPELPGADIAADNMSATTLTLVRWRGGERRVDRLAECHPHGYWMHWQQRA